MLRIYITIIGVFLTLCTQAQNATFEWSDLSSNTKWFYSL